MHSSGLRVLLILLVATFAVTAPALKGEILNYEDRNLLVGPAGAVERSFLSFFDDLYYLAYLPFYGLSYWVEGHIDGLNPFVFHLGNVFWHTAACFALYAVLLLLFESALAAVLGALLFALHPLHVESVAWISGRKELVSAFFLFLAWILHQRRRPAWAVAAFLVACFAKASAVVLPGLLLAAALLLPKFRNRRREEAFRTWPLLAAALAPVIVHLLVGIEKGVLAGSSAAPGSRLLALVSAWGWSLYRTVVPLDLSIDYPEVGAGSVVFPAVVLGVALAALILLRRRAPVISFGIAGFLIALAPFNNVFPATTVLAADRYLYLPLVGVAVIAAWVVARRPDHAVPAGVLALVYAALSFHGSSRFVSSEELWTRTIEARPASALAWFNRGSDRSARALKATLGKPVAGKSTKPKTIDRELALAAVADLQRAFGCATLEEHKLMAHRALIIPLIALGRPADALRRAAAALAIVEEIDTHEARLYKAAVLYDRGLAFRSLWEHRSAAEDFARSARLVPRYDAHLEAGRSHLRAGSALAARAALLAAARMDRAAADPWLDLIQVERGIGNRAGYKRALEEASRRAPNRLGVVEGWVNYWLDATSPDYRKARQELERLPEGSPDRRALATLVDAERALYHSRRGDLDRALQAADAALDGGLRNSRSLYQLAQIYMRARRYDRAVRCFRSSTDALDPTSAHRNAVARAYALKAHQSWTRGDGGGALRAFRAALDVRPDLIEAGAAPLRGEIEMLRGTKNEALALLAVAAVAGDPAMARTVSGMLFDAQRPDAERILAFRLRALVRCFVLPYDFKGAEDDLNQVLARDPKDRWARYRQAQARRRGGVGWMRTADDLESAARRRQGEAMVRDAIRQLTGLLVDEPGFHLARLQRGQCHFALDDLVASKADYERVRREAGSIREVFLEEAVLHRLVYVKGGEKANLDSAIAILRRALEIDPNYFDALYELGNAHHLLYDRSDATGEERARAFNRAILWYRRAMALNPNARAPRLEWARILLKAARAAMALGKIAEAHQILELVEKDAGDVADAHRERVRLNMRPDFMEKTGQKRPGPAFDQARRALERLEQLSPEDPALQALRALYHRRLGWSYYWTRAKLIRRKDEARKERARQLCVAEWQKALEAWPADPENASIRDRLREIAPEMIALDRERAQAAFKRGQAAFDAKRYREAADAFGTAVLLFPEAPDLRLPYGMALAKAGWLDRAREELEKVANSSESARLPGAMYELGEICRIRLDPATARVWYGRFVEAMEAAGRGGEPAVARARDYLGK